MLEATVDGYLESKHEARAWAVSGMSLTSLRGGSGAGLVACPALFAEDDRELAS